MTERTLLAWFFLFSISLHVQCLRTAIDPLNCHKDGPVDNKFNDQLSEDGRGNNIFNGSLEQGDDGHPNQSDSFQEQPLSLVTLHTGAKEKWGFSLPKKGSPMALALGCMLQAILCTLLVVAYCCRGPSSSSPRRDHDDDDSDGSVLAPGHGDDFVWWDKSKSSSIVTTNNQPQEINLIAPPWSSDSLDSVFNECRLGESWKVAKTDKLAESLAGELREGKSSLFSQSTYRSEQTQLSCIVYVLQVALHYVPDNLVLQEFTHASNKNHFLTDDFRLPKTKLRNCESVEGCFMRCITLKLGLSQDIAGKLARNAVLLRADEEETTGSATSAISNMSTNVRKLTFVVQLEVLEDKLRKDLGIDEGTAQVAARGMDFRWEHVGEDYGLQKLLKKAPDARKVNPNWRASGVAVLPWGPSDVNKELTSHGIAPIRFENDSSEFLKKLREGQVQLGIERASGNLVCVEHRVYLKLSKKNGDFLVHEGDEATPASLPYVLMLANETPWIAALRAARAELGSVSMRVELRLLVQDVQTMGTPEPPEMFSDGGRIAYVVRELMVEALAT